MKVYKASAGSGKTYTLALEYIKELLIAPARHAHRHILAVTFTKDATGEMKDRILAELYGLAFRCNDSKGFLTSVQQALIVSGHTLTEEEIQRRSLRILKEILHDYSRLHITTIDSFFQKVLRNLARELGRGSRFNLEMNSSKVLSDAVKSMIENAHENPQLLDWLTTYIENRLDEGGNWRIENEIIKFSHCIFDEYFQEHEDILKKQLNANPSIFEEIWKQHDAIQKDCRDFFRRTYDTVILSMEQENLSKSDFTRNGTVINFFEKLATGDFATANPDSVTVKDCCIDAEKWTSKSNPRRADIIALASSVYITQLNKSIDMLRRYNTSRMITKNIHQLGLIWDVTKEIEFQNEESNRFMLADTALFLNRMIDDSDAPFIYEKIGAEINHVMIDEFQDTSRLQWKNFKSLLHNIIADNQFSLIVGDVKQSIYRWRNGDWSILNNIEWELPQATIETLKYNFRSEAEVIDFNNRFFESGAELLNQKYLKLFGDDSYSPFRTAYSKEGIEQQTLKKEKNGYVSIDFIPDKIEDEKYKDLSLNRLIEKLKLLKDTGIPAGQICVLTRVNREVVEIAGFLSAQKENYPELAEGNYLNIVSNEAFQLNSSPAVKILIEALRVFSDPDNPIYKAQLRVFLGQVNQPEALLSDLLANEETGILTGSVSSQPLFEQIGHLYRAFQLEKIEGQSNYMFAFYDAINNYLNNYSADVNAFLKYWDEELQFKSVPAGTSVDGVRAMTIHKSKGLQFHTVLLPFCDWDFSPGKNKSPTVWCGPKENLYDLELLPVRYDKKMYDTVFLPEYEEETQQSWMDNLNILYVAFTRAECNLIISAKFKKKLEKVEDISNVSNLLQFTTADLDGTYNEETGHFEKGKLQAILSKKETETNNILKQIPETLEISFVSEPFNADKTIFKQSNKSREFVAPNGKESSRNEYIQKGNLMHNLFSKIDTFDDIEKAVNGLCFEGLITPEDKPQYIEYVHHSIINSGKEDWFSGDYRIYNECTILIKENGITQIQRPDRVLIKDGKVVIIDYKFGEESPSHQKQIDRYVQLMHKMGYNDVKGFVWYL